nr:hypothetical protein [Tanacetum cinerariifolium]
GHAHGGAGHVQGRAGEVVIPGAGVGERDSGRLGHHVEVAHCHGAQRGRGHDAAFHGHAAAHVLGEGGRVGKGGLLFEGDEGAVGVVEAAALGGIDAVVVAYFAKLPNHARPRLGEVEGRRHGIAQQAGSRGFGGVCGGSL